MKLRQDRTAVPTSSSGRLRIAQVLKRFEESVASYNTSADLPLVWNWTNEQKFTICYRHKPTEKVFELPFMTVHNAMMTGVKQRNNFIQSLWPE